MTDRWRKLPTWAKWTIGIFALLVVIGAATSGQESTDDSDSDKAAQTQESSEPAKTTSEKKAKVEEKKPAEKAEEEKPSEAEPDDCGNKAGDDCTPHISLGGSVRVDALIYKVKSVRTASELGDPDLLGEKADGRFVVVTLGVTSDKDESATLTDSAFQLEVEGNTYDPDSDGTIAAIGSGEKPIFFEDIGPDATLTGKVVFDVPEKVLSKKVAMRFNELGFGSTHGYIDISSKLG